MALGMYAKVKGTREGPCATCGRHALLTYDHVPPKGCFNEGAVLVSRFLSKDRGIISQNGTKFRSLCGFCNNTLLGTEYDPSLTDLVDKVVDCMIMREKGESAGRLSFQVDVLRIAKAIAGHSLACELQGKLLPEHASVPFFRDLKAFVLDPAKRDMGGYEIRYWFYPFEPQAMLRGYSPGKIRKAGTYHGTHHEILSDSILAHPRSAPSNPFSSAAIEDPGLRAGINGVGL